MNGPADTHAAASPRMPSLGRLPIIGVLRDYTKADLRADLRASLPVAAMALPQSMAFAMLAGFPPSYGAWTAIVAGFVGAAIGSSRQLVTCLNNAVCMLVTSLFAVLARQHADFDPATAIVVLALLIAFFEIVMGFVGMGDLSRFISGSVLQGFMLGTALLIAAHELGGFLGVPTHSAQILPLVGEVFGHLDEVNPVAVLVGLAAMTAMLLPPRWRLKLPGSLLAVVGTSLVIWLLEIGPERLDMVSAVPAGFQGFASPKVSWDLFTDIVPGAMAAAILGAVEAVVISSALASKAGDEVDNRWQLIGQGVANMASGLMRGLPCSSSFTRSFLNQKEGARSQCSAMLASLWILVVVLAFGPMVAHVPKAALAGVLLVLAWRLPDWKRIRLMLRATPSDRLALLITFAATMVVRLDTALYVGVFVSLALFLKKAQTPHLVEYVIEESRQLRQIDTRAERSHPGICLLHVEGDLFFAAAEVFEREVRRVAQDPSLKVVILRMKSARNLDATSVLSLANIAQWLRARGKRLLISGVWGDAQRILERSGVAEVIGKENIFFSKASLLNSTRDALLFAESVAGPGAAEVRIFREHTEPNWPDEAPKAGAPGP